MLAANPIQLCCITLAVFLVIFTDDGTFLDSLDTRSRSFSLKSRLPLDVAINVTRETRCAAWM